MSTMDTSSVQPITSWV